MAHTRPKIEMKYLSSEEAKEQTWSERFMTQPTESLKKLSARIRSQQGGIPVIVDRVSNGRLTISKHHFNVPPDRTIAFIFWAIRAACPALEATKGLLYYIVREDGTYVLAPGSTMVSIAYDEYAHQSGFMYLRYAEETTFG